jgi:hypothetical protein
MTWSTVLDTVCILSDSFFFCFVQMHKLQRAAPVDVEDGSLQSTTTVTVDNATIARKSSLLAL